MKPSTLGHLLRNLAWNVYTLVMGDIEIFTYDNCHLKYHGYCKYHDISTLVVTVQQTLDLLENFSIFNSQTLQFL